MPQSTASSPSTCVAGRAGRFIARAKRTPPRTNGGEVETMNSRYQSVGGGELAMPAAVATHRAQRQTIVPGGMLLAELAGRAVAGGRRNLNSTARSVR
jgi:hypothetical protein